MTYSLPSRRRRDEPYRHYDDHDDRYRRRDDYRPSYKERIAPHGELIRRKHHPYRDIKPQCFLCKKEGHAAYDCPGRCIGCGAKEMHLAEMCASICFICNGSVEEGTHHPFDCPIRCRLHEHTKWHTIERCLIKKSEDVTCFLCSKKGHRSTSCSLRCKCDENEHPHLCKDCSTVCNVCSLKGHSSATCSNINDVKKKIKIEATKANI